MRAAALEAGDLELIGLLPGASNRTFLARLAPAAEGSPEGDAVEVETWRSSGGRGLVVYKPVRGETPLWDFPHGTLAAREVAAYRVSLSLGWPRIPSTVLRGGPLGEGAVQAAVEVDAAQHYFTLRDERAEELRGVAAFDVIANNADRKGGHVLLGEDGGLWCIDHGLCFHVDPKLRTVIWDFAGDAIRPELLADVSRLTDELRSGSLREELGELLAEDEVEATAARAEALCGAGRLPEPGPGRVVPWPLI